MPRQRNMRQSACVCTYVCVCGFSLKTPFERNERNRISLHKLWTLYFRSRSLHKFRLQQQQWQCLEFCDCEDMRLHSFRMRFYTNLLLLLQEIGFFVTHTPCHTAHSWCLFNACACCSCVPLSFVLIVCVIARLSSESRRIRVNNCWFKPYFHAHTNTHTCTYIGILMANNYK